MAEDAWRIIRPWAAEGDYAEVIVPDKSDLAVPELTAAEQVEAALRYIARRYGPSLP